MCPGCVPEPCARLAPGSRLGPIAEPPATVQQLVELARVLASMLPANVSSEERDAALRAYEDSVAVLAEHCEELPTLGQLAESFEWSFGSQP